MGPDLAKHIPEISIKYEIESSIIDNPTTMFLGVVDDSEIMSIVNNCKGKRSTDCNAIDMSLLKSIMIVIKPFIYICNFSFKTGVFSNQMKTAEVIPLDKTGDRHQFSNYRTFVSRLDRLIEKIQNSE